MADKEIIRPPFKQDFPGISEGGYRFLQQIANSIRQIFHLIGIDALTTGIVTKTGVETYAARTITGTSGEVEVANGDGVSGNPTIGLPTLISTPRKFGTETDYSEFEADGTLRAYGAATTYRDINFSIIGLGLGASAPDRGTLAGGTIEYLFFDGVATTEEVSGAVEIDHDVRLAVIKPHIHWFPTTTGAGNVKWNLTYTITNVGTAEPAETTISVTSAAGGAIASQMSNFPDIDVSSFTAGSQFCFRLWRNPADAADTYGADVGTKTFGLHVEIQSLGTRTVGTD